MTKPQTWRFHSKIYRKLADYEIQKSITRVVKLRQFLHGHLSLNTRRRLSILREARTQKYYKNITTFTIINTTFELSQLLRKGVHRSDKNAVIGDLVKWTESYINSKQEYNIKFFLNITKPICYTTLYRHLAQLSLSTLFYLLFLRITQDTLPSREVVLNLISSDSPE